MSQVSDDTTEVTLESVQEELEKVKSALKKANAEAASYRKQKNETMTETEKTAQELQEERQAREKAESQLKHLKIKSAVIAKAAELGFAHPEDAFRLLDTSKVEITDDDKVTGFKDQLEQIAKSDRLPMLGKTTSNGSIGNNTKGARVLNDENKEQNLQTKRRVTL